MVQRQLLVSQMQMLLVSFPRRLISYKPHCIKNDANIDQHVRLSKPYLYRERWPNDHRCTDIINVPIILIIYVTIKSTTSNHTETSRNLFANKFKVFDISFVRSILQTGINLRVKIVFNLRQLHTHTSLCCNNFLALRKQRKLLGTLVRTLIRILV
jgi:hypothetical protein